jgi:hypothetical protein
MAYGLKYQSNFYNFFQKLISVKIYKDGYASTVIDVRTQSVIMEVNYQDENTPIVGTGVKINIINNTNDFTYFDDLLLSLEQQFKCVIEYDNVIIYEGFTICDINEQQFLPYSIITLQFTNYLRRLEDNYLSDFENQRIIRRMLANVHSALGATGLEYSLYINSTLFEDTMTISDSESFLHQTWIENDIFHSNLLEWDDTYTALNKMLQPFNAFLYSYGQKWIIERYGDFGTTHDWVYYTHDSLVGVVTSELLQTYTAGIDFQYIDTSQRLKYFSGVHTLKLQLNTKLFDSLVFNNFAVDMATTTYTYPSALVLRIWTIHEDCIDLEVGDNFRGMSHYFKFTSNDATTPELKGIYCAFGVQLNSALSNKINELTIQYKQSSIFNATGVNSLKARFFLRINTGTYANYFLSENTSTHYLELTLSNDSTHNIIFEIPFTESLTSPITVFEINKVISIGDLTFELGYVPEIILGILPMYYVLNGGTTGYFEINYISDIAIKIDPVVINNEITTELSANFIKTQDISLDLFDLDNTNYSNGFYLLDTSLRKSINWHTINFPLPYTQSLVDLFIKDRFSKYSKSYRILEATISCESYIKPFALLYDSNLQNTSLENSPFIITTYSWDLVNGTYNIVAEEYTQEEIIIT